MSTTYTDLQRGLGALWPELLRVLLHRHRSLSQMGCSHPHLASTPTCHRASYAPPTGTSLQTINWHTHTRAYLILSDLCANSIPLALRLIFLTLDLVYVALSLFIESCVTQTVR
jgi:hypothetical protein